MSLALKQLEVRISFLLMFLVILNLYFYLWRQCPKLLEEHFTEPYQRNGDLCHMSKTISAEGKEGLGIFLFPAVLLCAQLTADFYFIWSVKDSRWAARFD